MRRWESVSSVRYGEVLELFTNHCFQPNNESKRTTRKKSSRSYRPRWRFDSERRWSSERVGSLPCTPCPSVTLLSIMCLLINLAYDVFWSYSRSAYLMTECNIQQPNRCHLLGMYSNLCDHASGKDELAHFTFTFILVLE